jgi:DNA adenine methylase
VPFYTPLRYPGGKRKLVNYFKLLFQNNDLLGGRYVEPFAGGAAVAIALLLDGFVSEVWINDIDPGIYSFWLCVKNSPEELCRRLHDAVVTVDEWERQRVVQSVEDPDRLDLAFSTLFLNRTNRSGVIRGGIIGGRRQSGALRLDVRFNRRELIARIERIADKSKSLHVSGIDAQEVIKELAPSTLPTLIFLDPPYYRNKTKLYRDDYISSDHQSLATTIRNLDIPWALTYNNCTEICELYRGLRSLTYDLHYAAARRYQGSEVMFFSGHLELPQVNTPALIPGKLLKARESYLRSKVTT